MNAQEIRDRQKNSPDWLAVEMMTRIEKLEAQVAEMYKKPKRGRPPKKK